MKLNRDLLAELDRKGRRMSFTAELREANDDGSIPVRWHPAVFHQRANIYGLFMERFAPGSFAKTIAEADVRALINHDPSLVLARTRSGTLRLSEDGKGLLAEADMAATSYAQDLAVSIERGDVSQGSIGFRAIKEEWDESGDLPLRTVTEAQLFDVSIVTYPAYEGTDVGLRSLQFSAMLRALGLDELPAAERDALLMQVTSGDIAPEFAPVLQRAQERIAHLVPAGDEPLEPVETAEPAKSHSGKRSVLMRRHALLARKPRRIPIA